MAAGKGIEEIRTVKDRHEKDLLKKKKQPRLRTVAATSNPKRVD